MKRIWLALLLILTAVAGVMYAASATGQGGSSVPDACLLFKAAGESGIYVNLPNDTTPESIQHIKDAVAAGQPRILHWDPADADAHRKAALGQKDASGHLKFPARKGFQRDEYPPASSEEGGADSDVRYITPIDNSRSGQRLGAVMSPYCAHTPFIEEP